MLIMQEKRFHFVNVYVHLLRNICVASSSSFKKKINNENNELKKSEKKSMQNRILLRGKVKNICLIFDRL